HWAVQSGSSHSADSVCGSEPSCFTIASMAVSARSAARKQPALARRPRTALALVAVLAAASGALSGCSKGEAPDATLKALLSAWEQGKVDGLSMLTTDGQPFAGADAQKLLTSIEGDLAALRPKLTIKGQPATNKDDASAAVQVAWPVADNVTWTYD